MVDPTLNPIKLQLHLFPLENLLLHNVCILVENILPILRFHLFQCFLIKFVLNNFFGLLFLPNRCFNVRFLNLNVIDCYIIKFLSDLLLLLKLGLMVEDHDRLQGWVLLIFDILKFLILLI